MQIMQFMENFLKARLQAIGRSQEELGEALHRDAASISRLVNGKQDLALRQLTPAARFLDLSVTDLLSGLGIDPGKPAVDAALLADSMVAVFSRVGLPAERIDQMASMIATIYEHAARDPSFRQPDGMTSLAGALSAFAQTVGRK